MKQRHVIAIAALLVIAAAAGGFYFSRNPAAWENTLTGLELAQPTARDLTASGYIEAEQIDVAPQIGGRVAEILVEKGDDVEAGTLLVRLDGTLLEAQIQSARAGVEIAAAQLAQVKAGARPQQIRQAEAGLAQAIAARDGARQAWQDARSIRDNPQELNARIAAARFEVRSLEAELAAATAMKDAAVIAHDRYWDAREEWSAIRERLEEEYRDYQDSEEELDDPHDGTSRPKPPQLPTDIPAQLDFHMIPFEYWKAWVGVNATGVRLDQARTSLNDLLRMRNNPQELDARVDAARAEFEAAQAAVGQAEAQLDALRSGATPEDVAVVEAQLQQAQASLDRLLSEHDKLIIEAPAGGLVLELIIHQGELAAPGATLLTLGDLDEVTLTVYVPQDRLGQLNVGQEAQVHVDSFPGETFKGRVVAIASQAEFIPRDVQTSEQRVSMVFAVEITIPNPGHKLKPGVPADATIITEEG